MAHGYMGKILNVTLPTGAIEEQSLDEAMCRQYIGGYSLGASTLPKYWLPRDGTLWFELLLASYAGFCLILAISNGQTGALFLLLTSLLGFSYVAFLEIRESLQGAADH